VIPEEFFAMNV
jgi:hypothetical protein